MTYNIASLTTIADCDTALQFAAEQREELDFKKIQQQRAFNSAASGSVDIESELMAVTAEVTALETLIPTLPEGLSKKTYEAKLENAKHKKFQLINSRDRYGVPGLLQKQYTIANIDNAIAENDALVAAVQQRKGEL